MKVLKVKYVKSSVDNYAVFTALFTTQSRSMAEELNKKINHGPHNITG